MPTACVCSKPEVVNDLGESDRFAVDRFNYLVVLVVKLTRNFVQVFRFYLIFSVWSFFASSAFAESDEASDSAMPYKYIEWIELADTKAPEGIQNLIIKHLHGPYENALEFSKEAPIYTPSVEYVPYDVNKDGMEDVIGRIYSGSLCARHTGCPTVVLIKRKDGLYVESFNEEVDRLGVTDTGMLFHETRDFDFYKCEMYLLDERGYFNLQEGECARDE